MSPLTPRSSRSLSRSKTTAALCSLVLFSLSACAPKPSAQLEPAAGKSSDADVFRMLSAFGETLEIIYRHDLKPVDTKHLIQTALEGMETADGPTKSAQHDVIAAHYAQLESYRPDDTLGQLTIFGDAFEHIVRLDGANTQRNVLLRAITGMVYLLDDGSWFDPVVLLAPASPAAPLGGLGLHVQYQANRFNVCPIAGGPAAHSSIKCGDQLVGTSAGANCGNKLAPESLGLAGPSGASVTLQLCSPGDVAPHPVTLTYGSFQPYSGVEVRLLGDVLYIRAEDLLEETAAALRKAIRDRLAASNNPRRGVVLDLRFSSGGPFAGTMAFASLFLPEKTLAGIDQTPRSGVNGVLYTTGGDVFGGAPVLVLVNHWTSEGSAYLAAALRDNHRAVLLGTPTAPGSIILTRFAPNALGTLYLATDQYLRPNGKPIGTQGVLPDLDPAALGVRETTGQIFDPANQHADALTTAAVAYLNGLKI